MKNLVLSGILVSVFLAGHNVCAQEAAIDYKQLIDKCGAAIRQTKSYDVTLGYKDSFTINSQEKKSNSAELKIAYISPDRFKVEQVLTDSSTEGMWDGWIVIGDDYYALHPVMGWQKGEDKNRMGTCNNNSPDGIMRQLEIADKEYKRESIGSSAKDGIEYYVIKYSIGKGSVDIGSLPPELRDSKISGTYDIWIDKKTYLPFKQTSKTTYYSNEQNKAAVSTDISYSSYNNDEVRIEEPVLGSKVF